MKAGNPFTLTFGKEPSEHIIRYEDAENIVSTFSAEHPTSQTYMIEGVRGSGKTVLMTSIAKELSNRKDWVTIDLNPQQDLLAEMAMRLNDTCKKQPGILKSGFSITAFGFGVGVNGKAEQGDAVSAIETILTSLAKKKKKVLITIDEVLPDKNMRIFASQFQIFIRQDYPIFLLMTGLYENINAIQNDPALTFLLRTPKIRLEPLSIRQIKQQYSRIFKIDDGKARNLADITKGYAFAFQALGLLYYEHRDDMELEEILKILDDMLDDFVYKKIWSGLSENDRKVMLSMTEGEMQVKDVLKKTGMGSGIFSTYKDRLVKKGLLVSPRYGYVAVSLPRFVEVARDYPVVSTS